MSISDRRSSKPVSEMQLYSLVASVSDAVGVELRALRQRIRCLELGGRFVGPYLYASSYRRGDICSCDGSLWTACRDIEEGTVPGDSPAWQLSTRAGMKVGADVSL